MKAKCIFSIIIFILVLAIPSCSKEKPWKPGLPLEKGQLKVGVVHITDPFNESGGYAYAHQMGINAMQQTLGLLDNQLLYKTNMDDVDAPSVENCMRELIAQGAKIIFATSWGYMDTCEKLAGEFPSVIFAHATGYKYNNSNFTNYFGKVHQARYLSGIAAGMKTKSNKIGFVAAWGTENSEVTGGLNAFALGVEKANPDARIYVKITHSWFDPMGEAASARALIGEGCDVIAQHCDTTAPQLEAEKAGVWSIGYNSDMSAEAPAAVLTSVLWNWGAYYTALAKSVLDGTFTSVPYYGSLKDGIVDLAPLNQNINWEADVRSSLLSKLEQERQLIESGIDPFNGVLETNDGSHIGREKENLADDEIRNGINWYYRNIAIMK